MQEYHLVDDLEMLELGHQGEINAKTVQIDCSAWAQEFPGATLALVGVRPGEKTSYAPNVTYTNNVITWNIGADDTALGGHGYMEVRAVKSGAVKKSNVFVTSILRGVDQPEDVPAPLPPDWVREILQGGFVAEYGVTTFSAIAAAIVAGKTVHCLQTVSNKQVMYNLTALEPGARAVFGGTYDNNLIGAAVTTANAWTSSVTPAGAGGVSSLNGQTGALNIKTINGDSILGSGDLTVYAVLAP